MSGNSYRTLEFDSIRTLLLQNAGSTPGQERAEGLEPSADVAEVRRRLALTAEGLRLLERAGRQPYHDLPDLGEILPVVRVSGVHLEPRALGDVASFLEGAREITRHVARVPEAPTLAREAAAIPDLNDLAIAIRRAILPTGEVADDASPKLAELRRTLLRLRSQLTSVMEGYLRGKDADRLLQDKVVTTRNDRYVLMVKAEHRSTLPGVVHGSSGSGSSLFVEPLPAVELNNDIVSVSDDERREVLRILRDLTGRVGYRADDIAQALEILGRLDFVQACALLARDMKATAPEVTTDLRLDLVKARHPLLMSALAEKLGREGMGREPVPVSIRVGFGSPVLVISGPNTGGKTVALKTVGLLSLMALCGLHVPAEPGSVLPVFQRVYADIGDEQSIEANLSTFSAHLAAIAEMGRDLALPALVLLDEVGAGTDPGEGGALGVAIVDHFRRRGAMVVATTHHGLMKEYALQTDGVACASFSYDPETYAPTYKLVMGTPGRSLALEMAERLGLDPAVVADARRRVDPREARAEALLKDLEEEKARLTRDRERVARERAEVAEERRQIKAAEHAFTARRQQQANEFAKELQRRGERHAQKAAEAVQAAVKRLETSRTSSVVHAADRARGEAVQAIRAAQAEALADVAPPLPQEAPEAPVAVGGRARLRSLNVVGEVMAVSASGEVELAVSGKRLRVPRAEVVAVGGSGGGPLPAPAPRPGAAVATLERPAASNTAEINIVGKRVDEATDLVDKFLDASVMSGRDSVRIIHGFGSGALRRAVAELLDDHPHVASFRLGDAKEGGGGATLVELRG